MESWIPGLPKSLLNARSLASPLVDGDEVPRLNRLLVDAKKLLPTMGLLEGLDPGQDFGIGCSGGSLVNC